MKNEKPFIIAVSTGEGIGELFLELGADSLVSVADADSLTADDFRDAILKTQAQSVIILPNGASAYEAASSVKIDVNLRILPTCSIAEGYAALAAMPSNASMKSQYYAALSAILTVTPIDIIREAGDSTEKYSAISRGIRYSLSGGAEEALFESIERLFLPEHCIITLIVGSGVTNARRVFVTERLMEIYPDAQVIVYIGHQIKTEYYIAIR